MGKGIVRIYKYYQQNWPYPFKNTNFIITQCFDNSIQTQCNSDSYASVGENDEASSGLDKSTNHHGNTDGNNNDDSYTDDTSRKIIPAIPFLVIQSP